MPNEARPKNAPLLTEEQLAERWPAVLKGIDEYNDGFFFEAHEVWEDVWYVSPLPARTFLQGLIQLAAAFVHLARHEYPGTVRLLGAAIEKLSDFAPAYQNIDVARLVDEARQARDELAALGPERFEAWDRAGIPRILSPEA
jgi:predicted metal-dependent hydrolase